MHLAEYFPRAATPAEEEPVYASISFERGSISFGNKAIKAMNAEGKMIKFFTDTSRKVIAWKLDSKVEMVKGSLWRPMTINQTNKNALLSIAGIVGEFKLIMPPETTTVRPEIQKYIEQDMLGKGEEYFFVKLDEKTEETETA